jgi:hypothetical protein
MLLDTEKLLACHFGKNTEPLWNPFRVLFLFVHLPPMALRAIGGSDM